MCMALLVGVEQTLYVVNDVLCPAKVVDKCQCCSCRVGPFLVHGLRPMLQQNRSHVYAYHNYAVQCHKWEGLDSCGHVTY